MNPQVHIVSALTAALLILNSAVGRAQSAPDATTGGQLSLGPVVITPTVMVMSGIDTNVFNEEDNPKRDFTTRFLPQTQVSLRAGRALVASRLSLNGVYFRQYADQRSVDVAGDGRLDFDLARFVPYLTGNFVRGRQRASAEIDTRPLRIERGAGAGVLARLSAKTSLAVGGFRSSSEFGDGAEFEGVRLDQALNRTRSGGNLTARYAVTPITTVGLAVDVEADRFDGSTLRNADSVRILPGVEFSPFALITGRASVGLRRFEPADPRLAAFTAAVAAVDLGYVLRGSTRLGFRTDRDVIASYEQTQPYYVFTSWQASVTRRLAERVNVTAAYGRQRLQYRSLGAAAEDADGRVDSGTLASGTAQYSLGGGTSVGVSLDYNSRSSGLSSREYDGLRMGATLTYAF